MSQAFSSLRAVLPVLVAVLPCYDSGKNRLRIFQVL